MHYKAPDNSLHFLDDAAFEHLLPVGSVQITDEEAQAMRPQPDPKDAIKAQIAQLEASITPRRLREYIAGDHSFVPDVNVAITALRAQL
jgi:hypothetical protein